MARMIWDILPNHELLLSLEPEELAGVVLEYLNGLDPGERGQLNRHNFSLPHTVQTYPREHQAAVTKALMEAWVWLEREGLLAPEPGQRNDGWVFITRRDRRMRNASDLRAYQSASLLPRQMLHPVLVGKVVAPFVRGDYDTAVFQAFNLHLRHGDH